MSLQLRVIGIVFCGWLGCSSLAPGEASRAALRTAADDAMSKLVEEGFTGSVLVACGDEVLFQGDFGMEVPDGAEPSYWVASITKQFLSAAILQLVERGLLQLDDPLARHFPQAPDDKARITLFQLLTHQSGLPQAYAADGVTDRDAALNAILASPLASAPGERFGYSNDNYSLLAILLERVTGRTYEDIVLHDVFEPARLRNTGFWPDTSGFVPALLSPMGLGANWGFRGGTGARASVTDLHRWARALDDGRILNPESLARLYGPHITTRGGTGVGFNWFRTQSASGRPLLWTSGSESFGANAILYRIVGTSLLIIASTNAGPAESDGPGWSRRARDELLRVFEQASTEICSESAAP